MSNSRIVKGSVVTAKHKVVNSLPYDDMGATNMIFEGKDLTVSHVQVGDIIKFNNVHGCYHADQFILVC